MNGCDMNECQHENLQTIVTTAWFGDFDKEKLFSVRCEDCGEMTEFCYTINEARARFKIGMTGYVDISKKGWVDNGRILL